eukprot:CAMPEP_0167770786 /NCGR_PEP_ID=MMETSP0110_2-20121227/18130_1 /TAXON_ID=629695 /ORGANISM="Gymnochlora sp., Strain CCMP2014" /LENGTH=566 /DNA_ID=CAMNT_0007660037 /DNA_START=270 /DNA_END=1970 /DNA_ORIENTATION=-
MAMRKSKDELILAKKDVEAAEARAKRAEDQATESRGKKKDLANATSKISLLQLKNEQLQSRIGELEDTENLLKTYRSEIERMQNVKKANLKLNHELQNLRQRQTHLLRLENQILEYRQKEAEWEHALQQSQLKTQEVTYLKKQNAAWRSEICKYLPNGKSPSHAGAALADKNRLELSLRERLGALQAKEKEATRLLKQANEKNSSIGNKLETIEKEFNLAQKTLEKTELKLRQTVRERNSLKDMLENYDMQDLQDMKQSNSKVSAQRVERIRNLEVSLKQLEKENRSLHGIKDRSEKLHIEIQALEKNLKRLNNTLDSKEQEIAILHRKLGRGDYDKTKSKVLHMKFNPQSKMKMKKKRDIEQKYNEKIESLEAKLRIYEAALPSTKETKMEIENSVSASDSGVGQMNQKAISMAAEEAAAAKEELNKMSREYKEKLKELKAQASKSQEEADEGTKRLNRLKMAFKKKVSEFREACYQMTGYKIELIDGSKYRLRPMYAPSINDEVIIQFSGGRMSVLATDFIERLDKSVRSLLTKFHSIPAFLSQITLDQFNETTLRTTGQGGAT